MILKIKDALDTVRPDPEFVKSASATLLQTPQKPAHRPLRVIVWAACLLLVVGLSSAYALLPASCLYIDINPSLVLGVSRAGLVTRAQALNSDAETILSGTTLFGKTAGDAVAQVVAAAQHDGFLSEDGVVSLAATERDDASTASLLNVCSEAVKSEGASLSVYTTTVQQNLQDEAASENISPGKLSLIHMILELDSSATIDDYRDASVTDIVDRLLYLTSDDNTDASDELKASIRGSLSSVSEQLAVSSAPDSSSSAAPAASSQAIAAQPAESASAPPSEPAADFAQTFVQPNAAPAAETPERSSSASIAAASPSASAEPAQRPDTATGEAEPELSPKASGKSDTQDSGAPPSSDVDPSSGGEARTSRQLTAPSTDEAASAAPEPPAVSDPIVQTPAPTQETTTGSGSDAAGSPPSERASDAPEKSVSSSANPPPAPADKPDPGAAGAAGSAP